MSSSPEPGADTGSQLKRGLRSRRLQRLDEAPSALK